MIIVTMINCSERRRLHSTVWYSLLFEGERRFTEQEMDEGTIKREGRFFGFDFARAVSAAGIFAVHYIQETDLRAPISSGLFIAAQEWGFIFVTVFFIMSGALLEMRHSASAGTFRIFPFYRKRAASIYPAFYLVYAVVLVLWLLFGKETFSHLLRPELLFTVAGVDGYFASTFDTCYLIGEWFLGALIFLYLLFPLLSKTMEKSEPAVWCALLVLYAVFFNRPLLSQAPVTNIFSCLVCFAFGVTFARHKLYFEKRTLIPGAAVFVLSLLPGLKSALGSNLTSHLTGTGLFIILFFAGEAVMKKEVPCRLFSRISRLSYPFYLVHHVILGAGLNVLFRQISLPETPWKYAPAAAVILFAVSIAAARVVEILLQLFKRQRS